MIEYKYEIFSLYAALSLDGLNNVVKRVTWKITAKDDQFAVDRYFDSYLTPPDPNNFSNYDNLTMEQVLEWVKEPINLEELYANMAIALEEAKDPSRVIEKELPWSIESVYDIDDKYILVHNNEVVYGPINWYSNLFNGRLNQLGISFVFDDDITVRRQRLVPINTPTIIDENTKIYKVNLLNNQPEESYYTKNGNIVWDFSSGVAVGTYIAVDQEISEVKRTLLQVIENKRNQKEIEGLTVTVQGSEYKILTGPLSRLNLLEKYNLMTEEETCAWKFMENKWATLNKSELLTLYHLVMDFVRDLSIWERDKTLEIHNAETVDQLRTVSLEV